MATQLGALVLDVVARVGGFTSGMSQADRSASNASRSINNSMSETSGFDSFLTKIEGIKGGMLAVGAAVGVVTGAVGAMLAMANATAEADLKLLILSDRVSTSVEDLQKLTSAASIFGYEQEQIGDILGDFQEKLGEFTATEGGGANDFFEMLANNTKLSGDAIKDLAKTMQGKSGVEAIQILKNRLDELGASTQEQRFVMESFASELSNLAPIFADGGKGLKEYGDQMEESGIIRTRDAIEQSARFAAQQMMVREQLGAVKNQISQMFMPALSQLISAVSDGTDGFFSMDAMMRVVSIGAKIAVGSLMTLMGVVKLLVIPIRAFIEQVQNIAETAAATTLADGFGAKIDAVVAGSKRGLGIVKNSYLDAGKAIDDTILAVDRLARTDLSKAEINLDDRSKQILELAKNRSGGAGAGISITPVDIKNDEAAAKKIKAINSSMQKDLLKQQQEFEKLKNDLKKQYMNDDELAQSEYIQRISDLAKVGLVEELEYEKQLFNNRKALKDLELEYDLNQFKMTESEKLRIQSQIDALKIKSSTEYSNEEKALRLKSISEQYDTELDELKELNEEKLEEHKNMIRAMNDQSMISALSREGGLDSDIAIVGIETRSDLDSLAQEEKENEKKLRSTIENDALLKELLLESEMAFQEQRSQIIMDAETKISDLKRDKLISDVDLAAAAFGSMSDLIGAYAGESSSAFKAAFMAQKAFTLASVLLSSKEALAKAWASAAFPYNLPAVAVALAETGVLQAGVQAIMPQGMAHNGIDSIPSEGTWLLDKGERVLSPRQNSDLTQFLNSQQQAREQQQQSIGSLQNNIVLDQDSLVGSYMKSSKGDKVFTDYIKNNSTKVKRMLGAV